MKKIRSQQTSYLDNRLILKMGGGIYIFGYGSRDFIRGLTSLIHFYISIHIFKNMFTINSCLCERTEFPSLCVCMCVSVYECEKV